MNEREHLAAEYALGLLEGAELLEARGLMASDPAFAQLAQAWEERFAPLFAEYGDEQPPAALRARVLAALDEDGGADVSLLRRRLGFWKGAAAAASALAASLALVIAYDATRQPPVSPTAPAVAPTMVASVVSEDSGMLLSASWQPEARSLTLTPGNVRSPSGRAHELWIIPGDGTPRSLGVIEESGPRRLTVPAALAGHFARGATLAVSVEPEGGSPTGAPTGPVVATGALSTV